MNIWQPEPGETLLARALVTFATGAAARVSGMRWFRDTERNDIQHELPGWPEGPVYTARSTGGVVGRNTVKGTAIALGVAVLAVLSGGGGSLGSDTYSPHKSGSDTPDDRNNEVLDFPVMWAAPGTIARTLPWQLDPARSPEKHYRTHAIVTDRRLVIVGFPYSKKNDKLIEDEVLWEIPLAQIRQVTPRRFKDGTDAEIVFSDGSWCRLGAITRENFTRYLLPHELIPLDALTPGQRSTVEKFVAESNVPNAAPPVVSLHPCGHYRVEFVVPSKVNAAFGLTESTLIMDAQGTEAAEFADLHPDDF
ncbi:hypothetical protein RB628_26950 [Streptomyces sp. ADMS]|uniref:hypothetical protein n=1 Tax=Streptomyces sp. ADMS TaxID=3071415 RepID=UPI00296EF3B0|nr:hypothetical protein [Streptomyces sp. ADMS]MDW4908883.1 hypothetical protein [Streptomyces sp. ADMS]